MEMRRKDLAVTDQEKLDEMIQRCDCIRLAFADGTHPYIVPLSFGYVREGEEAKFYFHSAAAGSGVKLHGRNFFLLFHQLFLHFLRLADHIVPAGGAAAIPLGKSRFHENHAS